MTAKEILRDRRKKTIGEADKRTIEIQATVPEVQEIDKILSLTPMRIWTGESIDDVLAKNQELKARRKEILQQHGYPPDYDTPRFQCCKCNDTGYIKLDKCECLKALEAEIAMQRSNLAKGLADCTFDTFNLNYCTDISMKSVYELCRRYAETFHRQSENLLFYGGTGLGKTHLSAAIGNEIVKKGFSVVYESAVKTIADCKAEFFNEGEGADKYYQCDLLIVDDLGVEPKNEYNNMALTELINQRIVAQKPTIITTNLMPQGISENYGSRILSRLLGEFTPVRFIGKDVRMIKLK